jgi:hypothetical protein
MHDGGNGGVLPRVVVRCDLLKTAQDWKSIVIFHHRPACGIEKFR